FPDNGFSAELAQLLQERTEGHALFVAGMVQDWLARGLLARRPGPWDVTSTAEALSAAVPSDIHGLIDRQLAELVETGRRLRDLASAAGREFSAAALAGPADGIDDVERQCEALVERQLLLRRPEPVRWPDGTEATGYSFRHALYRRAIYGSVPANVRGK